MEDPRGTLRARLCARLVDDWRGAWRWWSVRAAALFGMAVTALLESPETLVNAIYAIPPDLRPWLPPLAGILLPAVVIGLRLWKQGDKK